MSCQESGAQDAKGVEGFQKAGVVSDIKCLRGERNEATCLTQGQKGDWSQQDGGGQSSPGGGAEWAMWLLLPHISTLSPASPQFPSAHQWLHCLPSYRLSQSPGGHASPPAVS